MVNCEICKKEFNNVNGLSKHLNNQHDDISKIDYYVKYINLSSRFCECGAEKKFRNLGIGFLNFCSHKCYIKYSEPTKYWEGKIQPKDMVNKRITHTDQQSKQQKRESTLLERYGDKKYNNKEKISSSNKGKKLPPRTKEHTDNIVKSKKLNNTLNHSNDTKKKIRQKINALYQSDDAPVTLAEPSRGKHKTGYINNMFYRSSYEKIFIEYCIQNNIEIISAETKEFRVKYFNNNHQHFYYPDFYLPDYDIIVEIKPKQRIHEPINVLKFNEAKKIYNFKIITENELLNLDDYFKEIK